MNPVFLIIIVLGAILLSITLHEAMHAFTSYWLGDDTAMLQGRLTLNPLAHIDPFTTILMPLLLALAGLPPLGAAKPVPFNPARLKYDEFGAALVGIAGPLTNLVLAIVIGLWTRYLIGVDGSNISQALQLFTVVNLGFFTFNMIPFPPLDGSRLLFAVAPQGLSDVMRQIEHGGIYSILIFFFFIFTFLQGPIIAVVDGLSRLILGAPSIL
jgi:Zn-dependent protease